MHDTRPTVVSTACVVCVMYVMHMYEQCVCTHGGQYCLQTACIL